GGSRRLETAPAGSSGAIPTGTPVSGSTGRRSGASSLSRRSAAGSATTAARRSIRASVSSSCTFSIPPASARRLLGVGGRWDVGPGWMTELTLPGLGFGKEGNTPVGNVGGATYDPLTKRLYLIGFGVNKVWSRLYVFSVTA